MFEIFRYIEFVLWLVLCFFSIFLFIGIIRFIYGYSKKSVIVPSVNTTKFAIIIPARNESQVIEALLKSIENNDYPSKLYEVYLIIEQNDDPTIEIAKKYSHTHIFFRKNLENVGKGYALDECIKYIYTLQSEYDAFLILDADNLISKNFLSRMNDAFHAGFDIACGKRENKDWNASVVGGASALTFTIMNSIQNKPKTYYGMNVSISGTGFYIKSSVLKTYCGWPFHSLTEDYELTNYSLIKNLKTAYVEDAVFYDEQPLKMKQSILQRTRWIKGYFKVQNDYKKKKLETLKRNKTKRNIWYQIIGGIPMIMLAITLIVYTLVLFGFMIYDLFSNERQFFQYLYRICIVVGGVYTLLVLFTIFLFILDRKTIKIKKGQRVKIILFHPIFLLSYIYAAIRAIFVKPSWDRIEHTINIDI